MSAFAYRMGVKDGRKEAYMRDEESEDGAPDKKRRTRSFDKSARLVGRRYDVILKNIDAYNGTGLGQVDVEG